MQSRSELLNRISLIEKSEWKKKICLHESEGELTLLELLIPLADREIKYLKELDDIFQDVESQEPELTIDMVHSTLSNTSPLIRIVFVFLERGKEPELKRHLITYMYN